MNVKFEVPKSPNFMILKHNIICPSTECSKLTLNHRSFIAMREVIQWKRDCINLNQV